MEAQRKFSQSVLSVAVVTGLLLMVPLVAMQFSSEVDWSPVDFIVMGALIFSIGFAYVLTTRYVSNIVYKIAIGSALGSTFLMIWANLAVGLIGSGPNWGNLMYIGVLAVGIIGTMLTRFTPDGLKVVMYSMAAALVLHTVIALLANMQQYPGSSVIEVIGVNAFFASLFAGSGLLFRFVALEESKRTEK